MRFRGEGKITPSPQPSPHWGEGREGGYRVERE